MLPNRPPLVEGPVFLSMGRESKCLLKGSSIQGLVALFDFCPFDGGDGVSHVYFILSVFLRRKGKHLFRRSGSLPVLCW